MQLPLRIRRVRLTLRPSVLARLLGVSALLSACGGVGGRVPDDGGDLGVDASVDGAADLGVDGGPPDFGPDRFVCPDDDGDGFPSAACGGSDCDDTDPSRFPGAIEVCDADDEDCDDTTIGPDADGDGAPYFGCCNGPTRCGADCDDTRRAINAGGIESCNGFDDDCDGRVDEEVAAISCADTDGDGRGPLTITEQGCRIPIGATTTCNDCDDANPQRFVGATELCNGVDDNCNLAVDEACECRTGEARACGSTTGECRPGTQRCLGTPGLWEAGCDGAIGPDTETCDGRDNDCDGRIDEGVLTTFFADCDADGFGDDATTREVCERPLETPSTCDRAVWVLEGRDCDDADPSVNVEALCRPRDDGGVDAGGATDAGPDDGGSDGGVDVCTPRPEACNGIDDDCDGRVDEGGAFGACGTDVGECAAGFNRCVGGALVCTAGSSPEPESCNGLDDDCNGVADDGAVFGAGARCGRDTGECVRGTTACVGGVIACVGEVRSVPEVCNGLDDDCDGALDEDLLTFVRYPDFDGDGYGLTDDAVTTCREMPGWVAFPGDCNDGNIGVYPGMGCPLDPDAGIPDGGFDGGIPDLGFDGGIPDLGFDGGIPDLGFDGGIPDLGFDGGAPFDGGSVSPDGGGAVSARASMPSPRAAHACAWMAGATNPQVLVWGGFGSMPSDYAPSTVLAYDPVGDTWSESGIAAPIGGRVGMGAVWTGSRFFVWGGVGGLGIAATSVQDGFLYDPAVDIFVNTAMSGAPSARERPMVVWTGSKVFVWGGRFSSSIQSFSRGDGALYDPATNTWSPIATTGAPPHRYGAAVAWTGSEVVVWGGLQKTIDSDTVTALEDGARYDPATNTWSTLSGFGAPLARGAIGRGSLGVWSGSELIVWGGGSDDVNAISGGGRYEPITGAWPALTSFGAPAARERGILIWAGTELIVQGGFFRETSTFTATGGAYDPVMDAWRAIPPGPPSASACAVYTGTEVIVTGGQIAPNVNTAETRTLELGLTVPPPPP